MEIKFLIDDKVIVVVGGTGSFGNKFIETAFAKYSPKKIIVFSRDEFKQYEMSKKFPEDKYEIRFFLGDIRDKDRLYRAFDGVDIVVHAAALKQVPACEYNPFEAVKTNIIGAQNIAEAAIDRNVKKVIALSTDKAVNPINLYGSTKLSMEKIFIAANWYAGSKDISFSLVRYGNVVGSRGSVLPFFLNLKKNNVKEYPITDERMTRFWITLDQSVELVFIALEHSIGGEVFVPKIPSMKIKDLVKAIDSDAKIKYIGIRPGEKLNETLVSEDEGRNCIHFPVNNKEYFVILPQFEAKEQLNEKYKNFKPFGAGLSYRSDNNDQWLNNEDLFKYLKTIPK